MQNKTKIILGIDPGTATTGFGVVSINQKKELTAVAHGCIVTNAKLPTAKRLEIISHDLKKIISKHKPDLIAVEALFFFKNQKTIIKVAQAQGAILLTASLAKIPTILYTPLQVKQAITGYGRAEKSQMQSMIKKLLNLSTVPKPDDAADALAIAVCCAQCATSPLSGKLA